MLEENATNHAVRRAVAHGETVGGLMRMGDRVGIVCAANALQPDGQNDNGWDQGLLFLSPSRAWLQPPGYVTQMLARNFQPRVVGVSTTGAGDDLDVTATRAPDGASLVLRVANLGGTARPTRIALEGFAPTRPSAKVEELAGPLDASNTRRMFFCSTTIESVSLGGRSMMVPMEWSVGSASRRRTSNRRHGPPPST